MFGHDATKTSYLNSAYIYAVKNDIFYLTSGKAKIKGVKNEIWLLTYFYAKKLKVAIMTFSKIIINSKIREGSYFIFDPYDFCPT